MRDPFLRSLDALAPPVVTEPDPWVSVLAAIDQLAAAIREMPQAPAPVVQVAPVDLGEVVMAVQALKGPATAEEIAEALAAVLRRDPEPDASTSQVLAELVDALKRMDFRFKGGGGNMMGTGGGSVQFSPTGLTQLSLALASAASGTWGYEPGTSGTVTLTGGKRVTRITAIALGAQGTVAINGGAAITLPYDSTDAVSSSIEIEPAGNLADPEIVFTGTDAFLVEYVT